MRYTSYVNLPDVQDTYDHIIAWGGGELLFLNYWPSVFLSEFIVDGSGKCVGNIFRGVEPVSVKLIPEKRHSPHAITSLTAPSFLSSIG